MIGLSTQKAEELLKEYGLNVIQEKKKKSVFIILFEQFNNFLAILLLVAATLSFFIGEPVDGMLIIGIVILNGLFGLYQEAKASQAIAALKQMSITKVRVIRDGQEVEVDSRNLVPGDTVFVEEGVKVPADGNIIETINLEINEAALTGESMAVSKTVDEKIYMGTLVSRGRGYFYVTATGMMTKFGEIASRLDSMTESKSPLMLKLEKVTKVIGIIGIVASILVFLLGISAQSSYFAAFLLAISLAVAVVPEGLPAVMTITLSMGVKEMARRKAIIRKLTAIETLGSVTLIATDKTGTLTMNKMKVKEIYFDEHRHTSLEQISVSHDAFKLILLNGILCSTASLSQNSDNKVDILGDPTEGALLFMALEKKQLIDEIRSEWKLIEEIPFDSVSKKMTVKVQKDGEHLTFSKGAPEAILAITNTILVGSKVVELTDKKREEIERTLEYWAKQGLRVLAFSYVQNHKDKIKQTFLGMTAIYDAPRPEIKEAVQRAHNAGIQVVMVTGDNEKTAEAIAREALIMKQGDIVLTGVDLDSMTDEALLKVLSRVRVFARTTPFHKHHIVSLYQKQGEIVAVTGDGVNDAIALKQADVGVAMGLVGTDVARETAAMVITDDNFVTIVDAIEEGRNIIKNLKNAVSYLLTCNVTEAVALIAGMILGFPHIFYPIQFLYINLITDGIPALALAFSPRDQQAMKRKPQKRIELLGKKELWYILSVGGLSAMVVIVAFLWFSKASHIIGTTAAFSILALLQSFIFVDVWLSKKNLIGQFSKLGKPIFMTAFFLPFITQCIINFVPPIAQLFKVTTIPPLFFLSFILLSFSVLFLINTFRILNSAAND